MFDSSKSPKAEAVLVSTASTLTTIATTTTTTTTISDQFQNEKQAQVPYQGRTHTFFQANIQHRRGVSLISTQSTFPPRPLAG